MKWKFDRSKPWAKIVNCDLGATPREGPVFIAREDEIEITRPIVLKRRDQDSALLFDGLEIRDP